MPGSCRTWGWVGVRLSLPVGFQRVCLLLGKPDHPLEGPQRAAEDLAADVESLVHGLTLCRDLVREDGKGISSQGDQDMEAGGATSTGTVVGIILPGSEVLCLPLALL